MKQKQFRLTEDQINILKRVATQRNCTETDIIRSFIDGLEGATQEVAQGEEIESSLVAQLRSDLEYERKRCEKLEENLRLSLETGRAKEIGAIQRDLKEATNAPIEASGNSCVNDSVPEPAKLSRWEHLKAFFRGGN